VESSLSILMLPNLLPSSPRQSHKYIKTYNTIFLKSIFQIEKLSTFICQVHVETVLVTLA